MSSIQLARKKIKTTVRLRTSEHPKIAWAEAGNARTLTLAGGLVVEKSSSLVPALLEPQCVSLLETKKTRWGGEAGFQVAG